MVSLSKHLSPETMFCVFSKYTSCRRQLDQPQAGRSVSLLSIHHPPEIIFCVGSCRQLNQPQAGLCLYCPYTIFQKLCSVSFLNTPSARLGYQGSAVFSVYHTEESPISFLARLATGWMVSLRSIHHPPETMFFKISL